MDLEFLAETLDFIGKMIIIVMAIAVHGIIKKEGKIDYHIVCKMKKEQRVAFIGILFLIVAYILRVYIKYV